LSTSSSAGLAPFGGLLKPSMVARGVAPVEGEVEVAWLSESAIL
jgi:hypothetical protein